MEFIHVLCEYFHTGNFKTVTQLSLLLTEQISLLQLAFSPLTGLFHCSQKFMVHQTGHGPSPKAFVRSN